ncbi:probable polygalacturonase At3g15720 [Rutidosis leptorrhynchoides]|uniref:probable polygalacturonase At3g15720 n=1 Tax=Rutidosis leptorrhynchoides TaxID=125765 RepID=UPI003A9A3173
MVNKAFEAAWQDACNDIGPRSRLTIPVVQSFLVVPITFQGPCNSPILHFQLLGTIVAPEDPNSWSDCESGAWLKFSDVNGLFIDGSGMIDGRGNAWWTKSSTYINEEYRCTVPPSALHFENCNGLHLRELKHRDSPRNHIGVSGCNDVIIAYLDIAAPASSPNTDGIDVARSTQVRIQESVIRTGDDCIAINSGSSQINITGVYCGPGHGISIGSLGMDGEYSTVEGVYVRKCNFSGTQNGARIKTWQGGSGYAKDIIFEDIYLHNVNNPILIDQYYCADNNNCPKESGAVNISNISYKLFQGTSSSRTAINFDCSNNVPCLGLSLDQINITSTVNGEDTIAYCNNAYGTSYITTPSASCLLH